MDKDSKFTRDENGYVAVRVVNSTEALPASDKDYLFARDENGNIAMRVVGAGGGGGGAVTSVNGQTGAVVLDAKSVNAIPQYTTMPTATSSNVGEIAQYSGTTDATYTNGYFYKCVSDGENPATYSWERTDVQPAGSGGGIDWAVHIDKPANAQEYSLSPVWTIAGGLPDGEYEFCFQILVDIENNVNQYTTYKERLTIYTEDGTKYARANIAYVIDGDWVVQDSSKMPQNKSLGEFIYEYQGDTILWINDDAFRSNIYGQEHLEEIKNVFKITTIKNINTGDEYTPTGRFYDYNTWESNYWTQINGILRTYDLVYVKPLPNFHFENEFSIYGTQDDPKYFTLGTDSWPSCVSLPTNSSLVCEFDFCLRSNNGDEYHAIIDNGYGRYKAKILRATGEFANFVLGYYIQDSATKIAVQLNLDPNTTITNIYWMAGAKGSNYGVDGSGNTDPYGRIASTFTPMELENVGSPVGFNNLGVVNQYDGIISGNYVVGATYVATATMTPMSEALLCTETSATSTDIVCNDLNALVSLIESRWGYSPEYIKEYFINNANWEYDVGNNSLSFNYNSFDDGLQYFTFDPVPSSGTITWKSTYRPAGLYPTNAHWEKVPATTGTTGTLVAANWSSSTQTITVNGVTASNNILVSPAPASAADWTSAGIICTAQGTDSLTFTCQTVPTNDIVVNVCILN